MLAPLVLESHLPLARSRGLRGRRPGPSGRGWAPGPGVRQVARDEPVPHQALRPGHRQRREQRRQRGPARRLGPGRLAASRSARCSLRRGGRRGRARRPRRPVPLPASCCRQVEQGLGAAEVTRSPVRSTTSRRRHELRDVDPHPPSLWPNARRGRTTTCTVGRIRRERRTAQPPSVRGRAPPAGAPPRRTDGTLRGVGAQRRGEVQCRGSAGRRRVAICPGQLGRVARVPPRVHGPERCLVHRSGVGRRP